MTDPAGGYDGFGEQHTWDTGADGLGEDLPVHFSSGAISSGVADAGGFSVYGGFNLWVPEKLGSVGFSVGGHWSDTAGLLELVDVDGDNLPDKVFQDGGAFHFRPNTSGPRADPGAVTFGASAPLPGLRTISEELSQTHAVSLEEHFFGTQGMASTAWTSSEQTAYLADANGDESKAIITFLYQC